MIVGLRIKASLGVPRPPLYAQPLCTLTVGRAFPSFDFEETSRRFPSLTHAVTMPLRAFLTTLFLPICLIGCDTTVKNDTSIEGEWTGSTSGIRIVGSNTLNESVALQIMYQEAENGELSGTGRFDVSTPNGEGEVVELEATGLRSGNTVESAFVSATDTAVYTGSVTEEGRQIEGKLDWNRHEGTARVVMNRQ